MKIDSFGGQLLGRALHKEGLLPNECTLVELHMPIDGVVFMRFEKHVTGDDIPKLIRALNSLLPEEDRT